MSLKSRIEAVLFLTDKPLRAQAVARIVNEDVQLVRQIILELIHEYETRQGGLEIADDDGYIIQVKDEYSSIIDEFVPMELPIALVRTLSAIALKQPIAQAEIIKIRGAGAYDHVKELLERELISKKEEGRSPLLSTTKKFQEYFRLSQDAKSLRNALRKEIEMQEVQEAEAVLLSEQMTLALPTDQSEIRLNVSANDNQDPVDLSSDTAPDDNQNENMEPPEDADLPLAANMSSDTTPGDSQNEDMEPPEVTTLSMPANISSNTTSGDDQNSGKELQVHNSEQALEIVVNASEISHM